MAKSSRAFPNLPIKVFCVAKVKKVNSSSAQDPPAVETLIYQ